VSPHPRVVWEDLTYPRVACFGAMAAKRQLSRVLDGDVRL
jgi:hypothetical protein